MNIAVIIGGWYYPYHLYEHVINLIPPNGFNLEFFTMSHRNPSNLDISKEMLSRNESNNKFDQKLYSQIITFPELIDLGYKVHECENTIGDYYFFNQWAELYDYLNYDYVLFMHDDNFILPDFKNILVDIFENKINLYKFTDKWKISDSHKNFNYIANSPVSQRKTARGSFSIWSKELLHSMNGKFPMENITLHRNNHSTTPYGHEKLSNWNMVGRNFQDHVEQHGYMKSTYRLSDTYRISRYMIEAERGLIGCSNVLSNNFIKQLNNINI
jgi:hypothetical protein